MKKEGLTLVHLIGPNTGHAYHPQTKVELNRRIDKLVQSGRKPVPDHIKFTTWTLRYNQCAWVTIDGLERHWQRAKIAANMTVGDPNGIGVSLENVSAFTIAIPPGISRGFRNVAAEPAYLMGMASGRDPGNINWPASVRAAALAVGVALP